MSVYIAEGYEPKFWGPLGYRSEEVDIAFKAEGPEAIDFRRGAHIYYRAFNDGDTPHHATFTRLCKAANMVRPLWQRDEAETLDDLLDALLTRVMEAV